MDQPFKLIKQFTLVFLLSLLGGFSAFATNYVVTNTNASANWLGTANDGSFGGAIKAINAEAAGTSHTITFNIPGAGPHVLSIQGALSIDRTVSINGLTQPGSSCTDLRIILSGSSLALTLNSNVGSLIRGLVFQGMNLTISGGSGNIVRGCFFNTNNLGTAAAGSAPGGAWPGGFIIVANSPNAVIGGINCTRNIFSGSNSPRAIAISASNGSKVVGNYIGTDINGTAKLGTGINGEAGITISNSANASVDSNTVIGVVGDGSDGAGFGILINGANTDNIALRANNIGVNANGLTTAGFGNARNGVKIISAATGVNLTNNIICSNGRADNQSNSSGLYFETANGTISNITLRDNKIGVDKNYAKAGNVFAGVYFRSVTGAISTVTISGNVIGDNGNSAPNATLPPGYSSGVAFLNCASVDALITGNYIGMTPAPTSDVGNYHNGIEIANSSGITVGGNTAALRNYFGYNKAYRQTSSGFGAGDLFGAALMINGGSTNVTIKGNYIGLNASGTAAPQVNAGAGRATNNGIIVEASSNITIGGTTAAEANTIANMDGDGVLIINGADLVQVNRNSFSCNKGKGINLHLSAQYAGKTAGNNSFAAPVIDISSITSGGNSVSGTCAAGTTVIEVFYEDDVCARACGDANKLQGRTFLGYGTVSGTTWSYTHGSAFTAGRELTATATGGNRTSEFSTCANLCTTPTITGPTTACANQTGLTFSTAQNADWTVTGGATITSSATGVKTITVTAGTGNFTVTASASASCTSLPYSVTITPNASIALSSAAGTNNQTRCINNAITNITYTVTNATGASVSGLPAGVTGSYSSGVFTITGIPSAPGTFNYTVTTSGGCGTATATGTIIVNPNATINLSSAAGTNNQTRCINNAITNITYTIANATGGTVTGLPAGVTGSYSGGVFTITGTPTVAGTFNYTVTATGGCTSPTATGTIIVNPNTTISLSSAAGTNNQTICASTAITSITYAVVNGTGASVTGLPAGVTGTYSGGIFTISGIPTATGTFNYTVTGTGLCTSPTATGTIIVTPNATITLSSAPGTNNQTRCINNAITNITYAIASATTASVTGLPAGVTGTYSGGVFTISGTPTASGTFNYTVTSTAVGGCGTPTATGTIIVTPNATITLATGSNNQTGCINTAFSTITYTIANATGASVTGLPAGMTGSYSGGVYTISGTPTAPGTFNFTVTATGGCTTPTATGSIIVNPNGTISLTSASGTNNQTVCINNAITNITHNIANATGATVTGLPTGLTGTYAGGVYTISGSPSASGTFNYTVTVTGGCGSATASGTIIVNPNATITLASGSANQTGCINTAFTTVSYTVENATGATVTGLPAGMTGSYSGGVYTISGTPSASGTFNFTVTATGGCTSPTATGTIIVNPNSTVSLTSATGSSNQTFCAGPAITDVTYAITDATGASVTGLPAGVTGTYSGGVFTISGTPTATGTFSYTVTATGGCGTATATGSLVVNPVGDTDNITGSQTLCEGATSITYSVTNNPGATYNWVVPTGYAIVSGQNTNTITVDVALGANSGQISVTETSASGCPDLTPSTFNITITGAPVITSSPIDSTCSGSVFNYQITSNIASTYAWDRAAVTGVSNAAVIAQGTNPISETLVNTTNAPIVVTYVITSSAPGCGSTTFDLDVKVNPLPVITGVTADATGICSTTTTRLHATIVGDSANHTFSWSPSGSLNNSTWQNPYATPFDTTTYSVTITDIITQCTSSSPLNSVTVNVLPDATTPYLGPDYNTCLTELLLDGNTIKLGIGSWEILTGSGVIDTLKNDPQFGDTAIYVSGLSYGENKFVFTITGTCPTVALTDTLTITLVYSDLLVDVEVPLDTLCTSSAADVIGLVSGTVAQPLTYNWVNYNDKDTIIYKPEVRDSILTISDYPDGWNRFHLIVVDGNGCVSNNIGIDSLFGVGPQQLVIPNLITPDGDPYNECWTIKDVNEVPIIPGAKLNIYNRWGQAVYRNENYKNGDFCGSVLADGIYFYEVQPTCGKDDQKGWLHIISNSESSNK